MNPTAVFPASAATLPLRLFRQVAPFTSTTWMELERAGDLTLDALNRFDRRLSAQSEDDLAALQLWLREQGTLPLRVHLRPRTVQLVDHTIGDVAAGPTALAIRRMLDDPLLDVLHSHQVAPDTIDRMLERWSLRYHPLDDASTSLVDELERHLSKNARYRGVLAARYGFRHRATRSLTDIADAHGFTRERARQLEVKAREPLTRLFEPLPLLHQAYRILRESDEPLPLQMWYRLLPPTAAPPHWWELRVVRQVHAWTGMVPVTWAEHEGVEWAAPGAAELMPRLETIASHCRAALNRFALPPSLSPIAPADRDLAVRYLTVHGKRFARSPGGWWVTRAGDGTDSGARAPRRLLTALGPLSIAELRGGLRRVRIAIHQDPTRRMPVPTLERLPAVLRTAGFEVDEHGMVRLGARQPGRPPGTRSAAIIRALRGIDHEVSWTELHRRCAAQGITRNQMSQLAGRSPLLRRIGRGRYTLRGSGVAVGVEEEWSAADAPRSCLTEERHRLDGTIVLGWHVDPRHAYARHPLERVKPREGVYFIVLGHRRWKVWVEGEWIRGLQRLEARLRRRNIRQMRLKFAPDAPEIVALAPDRWGPYPGLREWPGMDQPLEL